MHAGDAGDKVRNQFVKGFAQRFAPSHQHIVMAGPKVTRASCHSRAKTAFYTIAFWGIAGFLGHGEAETGQGIGAVDRLQPKRRAPGAIAPGCP